MNEEGIKVSARPILVLTCFILQYNTIISLKENIVNDTFRTLSPNLQTPGRKKDLFSYNNRSKKGLL